MHRVDGDELSSMGTRHPDRISGLVYLDAAYDRTDPAWNTINGKLPPQAPSPADLENMRALQRCMTRILGPTIPQSEIFNEFEFTSDGRVGKSRIPREVSQAIRAGLSKPDYSRLRVPVLALYAQMSSIRELPGYKEDDTGVRATLEEYMTLVAPRQLAEIKTFETDVPNARIARIAGSHYFFYPTVKTRTARSACSSRTCHDPGTHIMRASS